MDLPKKSPELFAGLKTIIYPNCFTGLLLMIDTQDKYARIKCGYRRIGLQDNCLKLNLRIKSQKKITISFRWRNNAIINQENIKKIKETDHSIPDLDQWISDSSQHPRLGSMVQ